ncbi:MAG TPA: LamG domain-containing protein, partial [Longimicrobiaceae bacterium]|nr:LamG domain-containing protein [Longimicrobiaceae bacterium]
RRWSAALPAGRAGGSNAVHAPAFDDAGRVYCTTASGTVAVLDPDTGDRVGLYLAGEAITTPPFVAAATAYYGCADPQRPDAFADGALHSVVFGETVVLRLGLDERGAPSHATTHARVEVEKVDVDLHALHLLDPSRSCVEAWLNLPAVPPGSARRPGGGVLGICPTAAGGSGVNLAVDEDGTVRYSASVLRRGRWRTLRVEAACAVEAGEWHHVAVSRDGDDHAVVYVDGRALDGVLVTSEESRKPAAVPGIRAYLGAEAGEALEAVRPFCGMIAEVRVWDTCLQPAELAGRMHAKLRGNEPDLLAYWDFDRQNVEDAGPEHHHGALAGVGGDPVWWLADAAFEKPSYPFVTTAARILQQPAGEPATYQLSVTVHRADGTGIAGHPLDLWYVRRRDDDPEETRFDLEPLAGVVAAAQPEPGTPSPDGRRRVVSATTGSEGTATFLVTPTRVGHAPAIDLRAGFMARNGRFHVNVLLDRQAMGSPTPPSLVVQSKLVQDYAYSSGGKIDESRDRSTWRTVIRATNADGSLRVDEPLSLWAQEQLTVQVAGRSYAINRENAAELVTDGQGEVVVVCDAGALTATGLMARAGFMHRNDRVVIAPDQDLHRQLGATRGSELVQKRKTRWKPGMKEGDGETLLPGEYAPHADKVAEAIVTVMAAAGPAQAEPDAAPRGTAP